MSRLQDSQSPFAIILTDSFSLSTVLITVSDPVLTSYGVNFSCTALNAFLVQASLDTETSLIPNLFVDTQIPQIASANSRQTMFNCEPQ